MNDKMHFARRISAIVILWFIALTPEYCHSQTVMRLANSATSSGAAAVGMQASDAVKEVQTALNEMIHRLDNGLYFEFRNENLIIVAVNEKQNGNQLQNTNQISFRDIEQFGRLNLRLKSVRNVAPELDENGLVARFVVPVPGDRIVPAGPYPEPDAAEDGYGDDPNTVIAAAILDLNAGNYETFMEKMFPPATIMMMKTDGRWISMASSLKPDAPLVVTMIEDLNSMTSIEPTIEGDTATYRLPNKITQPKARTIRNGETDREEFTVAGTRIIRLSRIGKSWRFYDSSTSTLQEQQSAYSRPPTEYTNSAVIVFEKNDGVWKLRP